MHRLRRALALTSPEWQVLLAALALLPWISLRLRLNGLAPARAAIAGNVGTPCKRPPAARVAQLVAAAARLGGFTCLPRALTLQRILRRHGLPADLRIGVRKVGGTLDAHAWVELHGQALMEPDRGDSAYASFEPPGEIRP